MRLNFTIDAPSPLIAYDPGWRAIASNDPYIGKYANATALTTAESGSAASFTFDGTGFWLFGARRGGYGSYNVTLDGATTSIGATGGDDFQVLLFGETNLMAGAHNVVLTNVGPPPNASLDLDFVTWEREIPDDADPQGLTVDNTDPTFQFVPPQAWGRFIDINSLNDTVTVTQNQTARATLSFYGSSVALYGSLSAKSSAYLCAVDDKISLHTPVYGGDASQQVLCFADGLNSSLSHTLTVRNFGAGTLSIDYARIWGTNAGSFVATATPPKPYLGPTRAIAFSIAGAVIVCMIFAIAGFYLIQRRNRALQLEQLIPKQSQAGLETKPSISRRAAQFLHLSPLLVSDDALRRVSSLSFAPLPFPRHLPSLELPRRPQPSPLRLKTSPPDESDDLTAAGKVLSDVRKSRRMGRVLDADLPSAHVPPDFADGTYSPTPSTPTSAHREPRAPKPSYCVTREVRKRGWI